MSLILKMIFRSMMEKKIRSFLIVGSLTLAIITAFLGLNVPSIVEESYQEKYSENYGNADYIITSDGDISIADIQLLSENDSMLGVKKTYGKNRKEKNRVSMTEIDIEKAISMDLISDSVDNFVQMNDKDVLISKNQADKYGFDVGDNILVEIGNIEKEFTVFAVISDEGLISIDEGSINLILSNNDESTIDFVYVSLSDYSKRKIDDFFDKNKHLTISDTINQEELRYLIANLKVILFLAFSIVIILSIVIVFSLYKFLFEDRKPNIATLRSIGISKKKANMLLYIEGTFYGVSSSIFGNILGYFLLKILLENYKNNLGVESSEIGVLTLSIFLTTLLTTLLALILPLLITFICLNQISRKSLKTLIFDTTDNFESFNKLRLTISILLIAASQILKVYDESYELLEYLCLIVAFIGLIPGIVSLFGTIVKKVGGYSEYCYYAANNLKVNKTTSSNISIIVLLTAMIIILFSAMSSVEAYFSYSKNNYDYNLIVKTDKESNKDYAIIGELDSVDDFYELYMTQVFINSKNNKISGIVIARDQDDGFDNFINSSIDFYKNKLSELDDDEIYVDVNLLKRCNLRIGDSVELDTLLGKTSFTIKGEIDSSMFSSSRNTIVMGEKNYLNYYANVPETIYLDTHGDIKTAKEEVEEFLLDTASSVQTKNDFFDRQMKQNNDLLFLVQITLMIGMGVGLITVGSNNLISFINRKKEFAILYSLSLSRRKILILLICENILSNMLFSMLSISFSTLMIRFLNLTIDYANLNLGTGIFVSFSFPKTEGLLTILIMNILLMSMIYIPRKIIKSIDVIEVLKEE